MLQQQKFYRFIKPYQYNAYKLIYNSRNFIGLSNFFVCWSFRSSTTVEILQVYQTLLIAFYHQIYNSRNFIGLSNPLQSLEATSSTTVEILQVYQTRSNIRNFGFIYNSRNFIGLSNLKFLYLLIRIYNSRNFIGLSNQNIEVTKE